MFYYIYTWECSHKSYFWVPGFDKKQSWHFILSKPKYTYRWCTWKFIYRGPIANYKKRSDCCQLVFWEMTFSPKPNSLTSDLVISFYWFLLKKKQQTKQKKANQLLGSLNWIELVEWKARVDGFPKRAVEYLGTCCSSYFSVCQHFICLRFSS